MTMRKILGVDESQMLWIQMKKDGHSFLYRVSIMAGATVMGVWLVIVVINHIVSLF